VRADRLDACYPPGYPPHARDPDLSGFPPSLSPAVRWVLTRRLGYRHLSPVSLGWLDRLQAALRGRRFLNAFPPFLGGGRLLDVGCATGRFLSQMSALGWETSGIEADPEAAAKARQVTPRIFGTCCACWSWSCPSRRRPDAERPCGSSSRESAKNARGMMLRD
jgi:SAM-dependent methyltransferase